MEAGAHRSNVYCVSFHYNSFDTDSHLWDRDVRGASVNRRIRISGSMINV